ncbi:hypothetical protein DFJ77DRAFT_265578 [Powellomyces hirtus]|nr:hypothetical protein DFJ77DRAFT_265578 [Powellomyces hirtus]
MMRSGEDKERLSQPEVESLTRIYALIAHRARRLSILHRHGDNVSVVTSYQELVIDCHSLLALIERRYFPDPRSTNRVQPALLQQKQYSTWSTKSLIGQSRCSDVESGGSQFPGAKQLALLQASGALKDSLNVLSRVIRRVSAIPAPSLVADDPRSRRGGDAENTHDILERDLGSVRSAARSILEVASRFEATKQLDQQPPLPEQQSRTVGKRASFASFLSRLGPNRTVRSFSDPTIFEDRTKSNGQHSAAGNNDRRKSFSKPLRSKASYLTQESANDAVTTDFRNVLALLSNLGVVIGSNLQEFRILKGTLDAQEPSQAIHPRLSVDMEVLEKYYEDALERVVPLTASLANLWEQNFIDSFSAIQRLRQVQADKEQEVARLTKQCDQFQKMNGALLEENSLLKKELEITRRYGAEPSNTPLSEDMRSLHSGPLPSPAIDTDISDLFLNTSGNPSIAVSPPDLDYVEILQEETNNSDAVVLSRLYSEVNQAQALLDQVQTKRSSVMQSLRTPIREIRHKPSESLLPRIVNSAPLWLDVSHPEMGDPQEKACVLFQTCWRGYVARQSFKRIKHRLMIVNEMLDTEASYVKGLLIIHKNFMIPLKEEMNSKSPLITRQDFDSIFRYVEDVMSFNQRLLDNLVERVARWHHEQVLGDVFIRAAESMKIYAHFVNNYDQAMQTLNNVSENPLFERKLQEINRSLGTRAPNLSDLLISPVQRPPRYLLMLKELLKRTTESHPDHANLTIAVRRVERTVQVINERKKRHGMMKQMQDSLIGNPINLITPGRFLTHSGTLHELNEASTGPQDIRQERTMFLFNDILVCTADVGTSETKTFKFAWALPIADMISVFEEADQSIKVSWKHGISWGVKILYGTSVEDHKLWFHTLAHSLRNIAKLPRRSSLQGAGLILPPTDNQIPARTKTLQTINRTIQKLESDIQQETKVIHGITVLESLVNHRDRDTDNGWIGKLNEKMNGKSIGRQKEDSQRKLGSLKIEVSRQNALKQQFEVSSGSLVRIR